MILFIRSSLIHRDVRAGKYVHYLKPSQVMLMDWDRQGERIDESPNHVSFKLRAGYGKGFKSLFKFLQWNAFIFKTIWKDMGKVQVLHISDLDCFPGAFPFAFFGKKIVFDCYDFFTASRMTNPQKLSYRFMYYFEMLCLKLSHLLILPADFRAKHLNFKPKNLLVCENVPMMPEMNVQEHLQKSDKIQIVYAGTLERDNRGLEWIPEIARILGNKVIFYIAGSGELSNFFEEAASNSANIKFLGQLSHEDSLRITQRCDLIYAIYLTRVKNNVMAAPNKFYESMFLGVPLVTNRGTLFSEIVSNNNLGFVGDENKESIIQTIDSLTSQQISEASSRGISYWKNNYSNYLSRKYQKEYQEKIEELFI